MPLSVHTNRGALTALQNLNTTNADLEKVQNRVNTGLRVQGAKDNASVWAIAQGQRADVGGLAAVKMSLDRATSIADVAASAGSSVSDLLVQIKEKVVAAMDPSIDTTSRTALNNDYKSLLQQITKVIANAEFDGANILNGSLTGGIRFLANGDGSGFITLGLQTMTLGGAIVTIPATSSLGTVTLATTAMGQLNTSIANVSQALGALGSQTKQIENHNNFVGKLNDVLQQGIGNLVDADLAKESARLQALQVQQQLGAQALSIANSAPQIILSLFRN